MDTVVLIVFLAFVAFWMLCVFKDERKRNKAIVDKEQEQLAFYQDFRRLMAHKCICLCAKEDV